MERPMPDPVPALTEDDYAALTSGRNVAVTHGAATLWLSRTDDRFVMQGPSGTHSLLVVATDLDRLNAHWRVFAAHDDNQLAHALHASGVPVLA
jgi:hypothetical protein